MKFLLRLMIIIAVSQSSHAIEESQYTLDMRGVELKEFINTVSKMIGKTIIIDPSVRGKVDIQSPKALSEKELYNIFLVQLGINGYSVVDNSSGILKVIPSQGAKLEGAQIFDSDDTRSNNEDIVTRIVEVKNVNANQLSATLRPLVDPKRGIIASYDTSNVILITDRSSNVRRISQIIERVDKADSQTLELIPLHNASAAELERIIKNLVQQSNGKQGATGSALIASDQRTNILIVKADEQQRKVIKRVARQLDSEVQTTANTKVIYLKYAKAKEIVQVLKGISDTIIKEETQQKGSAASPRTSYVNVDVHEPTNTVVMSGSPHIIKTLESVIAQLDIRRAQVLVEAIIAEVSEDKSKELGVQWLISNNGNAIGGTNFRGAGRTGIVDITNAINKGSAAPNLINNGASLGFGKLNLDGVSFAAFINALESDSDSNILSTPSIVTLDNEEASIQVGQEVPIITGSTAGSDNSNPFQTITRKDIGIKLKVTPQINEGDAIQLKIEQEVSSLSRDAAASDIITNKRLIQTSVLIDDGGTITLGGLINEDVIDTSSKVPFLGDIPLVGSLFRSSNSIKKKRTLMVFLRPTIIRSQYVANEISRKKYNYLHAQQEMLNSNGRGLISDSNVTLEPWQKSGLLDTNAKNSLPPQLHPLPPVPPEDVEIIEHSFQSSRNKIIK